MIISAAFNVFLIIILTGFSFALKKLIYKNEVEIHNLDILYGLFFLILISLILNFFSPLRFFLFIIILIGLYFFFKGLINKKIKINFFFHFIIIFIFTIIIYKHGDNVDTPMYHLQIIKWLYNEKIVFPSDVATNANGKRIGVSIDQLPTENPIHDIGLDTLVK